VSTTSITPERMVIAIDPHKASWTAAVVDASQQPVATIRVPVSRDGYRALRRFANRWPDPTWAIEGASGLGAPLTARLRTDGIDVVDVPAKLAARVRMLSTGHGRKNDDADAVSVAIAARSARTLNSAAVDGAVTALRAIVEHRNDLVKTRTQTVNRLHVVLTNLIPEPPNSYAGSVPAIQPVERCVALLPTWSLRYASWTAASPRPPQTYRPQSPTRAPL
jgi:transposase